MVNAQTKLAVEIVYALRHEQAVVRLEVNEKTTARQAIELSGLRVKYPEIDSERAAIGLFGKLIAPDTALRDGDRIEIYRPLALDPKERRARKAKASGTR
jgi:putative ubiquitin-RnfH superfamily antitoxin RatB of RatAB toxin-antitoxin module